MAVESHRALARAKVNLALRVLARETSGYHQIETVFCALELADELEIDIGYDGIRLDVVAPPEDAGPPPDLGPVEANLAYRAAALFFEAAALPPRAAMRLTKRIPAGAGLGGGSSDAAAVLGSLNTLNGRPLTVLQLLDLAGRLGSDVPFFVAGCDLALAWGRGNRLAPLPSLPSRPVLLAVPSPRVATAEAYAELAATRDAAYAAMPLVLSAIAGWEDVPPLAVNDFEEVVFRRLPQLASLRQELADAGAIVARMTGTGSAMFAVFEDSRSADAAYAELAARHPDMACILTTTP